MWKWLDRVNRAPTGDGPVECEIRLHSLAIFYVSVRLQPFITFFIFQLRLSATSSNKAQKHTRRRSVASGSDRLGWCQQSVHHDSRIINRLLLRLFHPKCTRISSVYTHVHSAGVTTCSLGGGSTHTPSHPSPAAQPSGWRVRSAAGAGGKCPRTLTQVTPKHNLD